MQWVMLLRRMTLCYHRETELHGVGLTGEGDDELTRDDGVVKYQVVMSRYQVELARSNAMNEGLMVSESMVIQMVSISKGG